MPELVFKFAETSSSREKLWHRALLQSPNNEQNWLFKLGFCEKMHYNICNIGPLKLFSSRFFLLTKLMMSSQMSSKKRETFVQERENPKVKITFFVVEEKSVILRFLLSKSERMNHRNTKCLLYTLKTFVSSSIIIIHFNFTNNTYI